MLPKDIYTIQEIRSQIASNDYNAEMMLQHLLLRYDELEKKYAQAVSRQVIINEDDNHVWQRKGCNDKWYELISSEKAPNGGM